MVVDLRDFNLENFLVWHVTCDWPVKWSKLKIHSKSLIIKHPSRTFYLSIMLSSNVLSNMWLHANTKPWPANQSWNWPNIHVSTIINCSICKLSDAFMFSCCYRPKRHVFSSLKLQASEMETIPMTALVKLGNENKLDSNLETDTEREQNKTEWNEMKRNETSKQTNKHPNK